MSKLPLNNGLLLFNKTVREVKIEFQKQGRTEKWGEIQKWTSKNVFQEIKHKSHKKVTKDDILSITLVQLDKQKPVPSKSKCESVVSVPVVDRIVDWWDILQHIQRLPHNVLMRINTGSLGKSRIDYCGNFTESEVHDLVFTKEIRELSENSYAPFEGIDKIMPDKKDDGKPCSYFIDWVLTYPDGTLVDTSQGVEVDAEWKDEFSTERKRRFDLAEKKNREAKKEAKRKEAERPKTQKGEKKPTPKAKPETTPTATTTTERPDIIRALELLKEDFKDGIFTKEEYKEERALLISKFESGGRV